MMVTLSRATPYSIIYELRRTKNFLFRASYVIPIRVSPLSSFTVEKVNRHKRDLDRGLSINSYRYRGDWREEVDERGLDRY